MDKIEELEAQLVEAVQTLAAVDTASGGYSDEPMFTATAYWRHHWSMRVDDLTAQLRALRITRH